MYSLLEGVRRYFPVVGRDLRRVLSKYGELQRRVWVGATAMKGIDDLRVAPAGDEHARQLVEAWLPVHIARATANNTKWSWRWFPWDAIIKKFVTVAAVDSDGNMEGLLAISAKTPFLKIEFLSTAPWNFGADKLRRGVGPGLLTWAIGVSKDVGFGGALTLSSTPESESFYESKGFVRTGEQDHEELAIFQLPIDRVATFLASHDGLKSQEEV